MTPEAPASITLLVRDSIDPSDGAETPTTTGTCSSIRVRTRLQNDMDSSGVSFGASPITPKIVIPDTPASR